MGLFSRWFKAEKKIYASDILARLPGSWAGPGKVYTPAGVQNYRVELTLAAENVGARHASPLQISGKMISYFESGTILDTPVQLKLEKDIWSLIYTQTNVHGQGKFSDGKLEFLQKDPSGKPGGQTVEIWNLLSSDHLFIENFILGPDGKKEPFLKIMLQKT
ncbi:MAG: hypothetical protein L0196_11070 [candidate division Zixibacteria bacterium]|nr:hypothetical protein [candidate division Zixibacteria bacterium]